MTMLIRYSSAFKRMYRKLSDDQQKLCDAALRVFADNPFQPQLRNHKLQGSKQGLRSISAGYDLRIIYVEEKGHTIILLVAVGTHDTVY